MDANDPAYAGTYPWAAERAELLARIAELEAQAAVLAKAAQDFLASVDNMTIEQFQTGRGLKELGVLRTLFANLPAVAQQHLERDRAAENLIKHTRHHGGCRVSLGVGRRLKCDCGLDTARAAYRAASGGAK